MSSEDPPASARVAVEWLRRVEAEYTSAAATAELVQWLIRLGASPDLIRDGLRIVDDELEHATLSHATATAAGTDERPRLVQEHLGLRRHLDRPLLIDAALQGVEIFCLGETVAVPLFVAMREGCTVPVARKALDRIVRDEVRHRDFGWTLLEWLVDVHGEAMREVIDAALPAMFVRIRSNYGQSDFEARGSEPDDADTRWGLMPAARYHEILLRTLERDYVPRFARVGIDARAAWRSELDEQAPPPRDGG
jgi:hypothetical protein